MTRWFGRALAPLAVCALVVVAAAAAPAADEKTDLDKKISAVLVAVIDKGVDLYNTGEYGPCYRLYEGALQGMRPFLDSKPAWQKTIDDALADASKQPSMADRAFALRRAMDKIYFEINPKKVETPPTTNTLWDRLGGEKGVTKIVDDFMPLAAKDPKVNFDRDGKYKFVDADIVKMKKSLVEMVSSATGGPLKYTGKSMAEAHKGMGVTNAEFDAGVAILKKVLDDNKVKKDDADALVKLVEGTRKDIVETKSPEPPKDKEGEVKGKLLLDGKPLAKATVSFTPEKGDAVTAKTGDDGGFTIKGKTGAYKVSVKGDAADKLPAKYADVKTSGLTSDVKEGSQTLILELKGEPKPPEPPKDGEVSGTVTMDGKPLAKATVTFTPEKGAAVVAKTDDEGKYAGAKVPPGTYTVTVKPDAVVKGLEKYADPKTSGLKADVKEGKNSLDFKLAADKPEKPEPNPEEIKTGTVTGKVTLNGKPVVGASVLFLPDKGNPTSAAVKDDGTYSVEKLPVGKYKLAVVELPVKPDPAKPVPAVKVPQKYADPEKSGLTFESKEGKNTFDIELK